MGRKCVYLEWMARRRCVKLRAPIYGMSQMKGNSRDRIMIKFDVTHPPTINLALQRRPATKFCHQLDTKISQLHCFT